MKLSLKNTEYLIGDNNFKTTASIPYNKKVCEFIFAFSKELLNHRRSNEYPDLKTLGFWCRKQNILSLKKEFDSPKVRKGIGLVFHITPSNIPTNFAYSLLFGLLTGNSNIVKVPSKSFEQVKIICSIIKKILNKKLFLSLKNTITIIRYSNNDLFTKTLSLICDGRLIWGGDNSIKNIREFKIKNKAIDIAFTDKFSFCAINAKELIKLNKFDLDRLIERFYNDTYLVDQNACSSPHLIVWLNDTSFKARNFFWKNLNSYVLKKYNLPIIASVDKYTKLCENLLNLKNIKSYQYFQNLIYIISLKYLDYNTCKLRGKWGFFYEYHTNDLKNISKFIEKNCQTLTYFGLTKDYLKNFVIDNKVEGIDRIVPIGQALNIGLNWDGYDINKILTRVVDIK
mgnify:FL=1|tara:strand:+ start:595 stop:1788 length:1194 start_codon:yes stop_codon:yes gene_type:complete